MDPQKHLLREILGPRPILNRASNQCEHQRLVTVDQFLKRALIASTAAFDELALVDSLHPSNH